MDWEFQQATLIQRLKNGTVILTGYKGLLYVTLKNKQNETEMNGTVCHDDFNTQAAQLFCQGMGFQVEEGVWGSSPAYKYISR